MSFGSSVPDPVAPAPPPSAPIIASKANAAQSAGRSASGSPMGLPRQSLISTSSRGLRRKADTQKVTLVGGS